MALTTHRHSRKFAKVFRFETELALASKSNTELRDPQANYNKMTLKEFESSYPNIPLAKMSQAMGVKARLHPGDERRPARLSSLPTTVCCPCRTPMSLRAVMEWDLINSSSSYLTDEIRQARFNFFGKTMSGRKEEYPLWKRATNEVENAMGEALGKMYCERYFPGLPARR